ncbi:MAG TPA: prolyl oligopeptidase family serine peptidase [Terriglobales bacterium]|nr:prolyl oligopeptidase family serine peptidase [Terriglobales bacterium]
MRQLLLVFLFLAPMMIAQDQTKQGPPPTRREDVKDVIHGVTVEDPYRWLEDQNSPETRKWIDAQNKYTMSLIGDLPSRPYLKKRLGELLKVDATKTPVEANGRVFFLRRAANQDQYVLYMQASAKAKPKVLVDPHPMSADHSTSVVLEDVIKDGSLVSYGIRLGGADEVEVRFLDVNTGKELKDVLPAARYFNIAMTPDRSGLYYDIFTDAGPRVRWHKFGTDVKDDVQIFGEGLGRELGTSTVVNDDGRYAFTTVFYGSSADKTEVYYLDRKSGAKEMTPLIKAQPGQDMNARFIIAPAGDRVFVHTNWRSPNGRVLLIDMKHPLRPHWQFVIPEDANATIESIAVTGGKLAVAYLRNVVSEMKFFTPDGRPAGEVSFPTMGTVNSFSGRWDGTTAFFQFSSFHVPATIYRFNSATNTKTVFAQSKAPVNSSALELKQVWYTSKDGTKVPMFLLYKKGLKLDGAAPVFLTGYGGFNVSETPEFRATAVVWAENGGVYALPNLRGGGEFGEAWHKAGMMENKQNVFDDFIAAAEWLVANKYTNPQRLAASGGSNGGLLMGAMMTQRPDLFRALVCSYPLLDMIRYQDFLIAKFWVPEYGSSVDAKQFESILKYSPYHNVKKGTEYPAVMFVTGDSDTRVAPLHARKMAALMQWAQGGKNPILLHYDTKAGHSEGRSVTKYIEDYTDQISFLWWQLGVDVKEQPAKAKK